MEQMNLKKYGGAVLAFNNVSVGKRHKYGAAINLFLWVLVPLC